MPSYASFEDIDLVARECYGWHRAEELDSTTDDMGLPQLAYLNDEFPTWKLFIGNLGTNDAYAVIENDRGHQFIDCNLFSWEYDEALDYFNSMLSAVYRDYYDKFK